MTNVLALPTALLDPPTHATGAVFPAGGGRAGFQAELSITATRFEFAVGVGAMLGGLVGLGVGGVGGCIVGATPASAVGSMSGLGTGLRVRRDAARADHAPGSPVARTVMFRRPAAMPHPSGAVAGNSLGTP
jgi:hypothetical protein